MAGDLRLQHFAVTEFACHSGEPYPLDRVDEGDPAGRCWAETRLARLMNTLEAIRHGAGDEPIEILSGYRTESYQGRLYAQAQGSGEAVAPAATSQHPRGEAADIRHRTLSATSLHDVVLRLFEAGKLPELGGLGLYVRGGFIHVDVRKRIPADHLAHWNGDRTATRVA